MKKANLTIIATIIATLVISMFSFQPTVAEASNNVSPTATPSPCRKLLAKGKLPNSNRPSKQVKNKNCQEFEAIRPRKSRKKSATQHNPKEIGIDKITKRKASKN